MSEARYQSTADLLEPWRDDVLSGKPPTLFPVGTGELARIDIGPGLVTLIGGAPGAGKTALTMQWMLDALFATPSLKALMLNVEMSPSTLLDRQLARLAGIDGSLIRHRRLTTMARLKIEHHRTADRQAEDEQASFSVSLRASKRLR
jgi:replicative DNA helicase